MRDHLPVTHDIFRDSELELGSDDGTKLSSRFDVYLHGACSPSLTWSHISIINSGAED